MIMKYDNHNHDYDDNEYNNYQFTHGCNNNYENHGHTTKIRQVEGGKILFSCMIFFLLQEYD